MGSKSCRGASAGIRFCVAGGGGGGHEGRQEIVLSRGMEEFGLEELPQGERRETILRGGGGRGGAAA